MKKKQSRLGLTIEIDEKSLIKAKPRESSPSQYRLQFEVRLPEVESWFAADPKRVARLATDPDKVVVEMARQLGMALSSTDKRAAVSGLARNTSLRLIPERLPTKVNPGSQLLNALALMAARSESDASMIARDPQAALRGLASELKVATGELEAALRAFRAGLAKHELPTAGAETTKKAFPARLSAEQPSRGSSFRFVIG